MHYIGFDLHKKWIWTCSKTADGTVVERRKIASRRNDLTAWAEQRTMPWIGIMEATLFTGWVYDTLLPHAVELKVVHPAMAKAISAGKHSNDRIDAEQLADMGRCNWVPECHPMPAAERQLRQMLRYRHKLLGETVRFKNMISGMLMAEGVEYDSRKLHNRNYFPRLVDGLSDIPESSRKLFRLTRSFVDLFNRTQQQIVNELRRHPRLKDRVARLESIDGVGPITALTWALEVGDPQRFSSYRKACSYCGLTSNERSSADKIYRGPLSKQRNKYLQSVLVEAANLAPRFNAPLKALYEKECGRGHHNRATIAVARKLVAYLLAVDKSGRPFQNTTGEEAKSNCIVAE